MLAVTAQLEGLSTDHEPLVEQQVDLYWVERVCCEAEESEDCVSSRLEAAYLSHLRESLLGNSRATHAKPVRPSSTNPWLPRRGISKTHTQKTCSVSRRHAPAYSTFVTSSVNHGRLISVVSPTTTIAMMNDEVAQEAPASTRIDETPELNAWARAAAEQEASNSKGVRRKFWASAALDVEGLGNLTIGD